MKSRLTLTGAAAGVIWAIVATMASACGPSVEDAPQSGPVELPPIAEVDAGDSGARTTPDATPPLPPINIGNCPASPTPPAGNPACAGKCGNGVVDSCTGTQETCDGTNLNGHSCSSLGFAGGALACKATCSLAYQGCTTCLMGVGTAVASCKESGASGHSANVALTATKDDVAFVWSDDAATHFVKYASDMHVIAEGCLEIGTGRVHVARASSAGYIVVVESFSEAEVLALDGNGMKLGPARKIKLASGGFGKRVVLAERREVDGSVTAGPLVASKTGGVGAEQWSATLLDVTGADTFTPVTVPFGNVEGATWTGSASGFLIAGWDLVVQPQPARSGWLVPMSAEGKLGTKESIAANGAPLAIAWDGTSARVLLARYDVQAAFLARTSALGIVSGQPAQIAYPLGSLADAIVPWGTSSLVASNRPPSPQQSVLLSIGKLAENGANDGSVTIARSPSYTSTTVAAAGDDLVVAWGKGGETSHVGIARLHP